jgi:hypothetical protein
MKRSIWVLGAVVCAAWAVPCRASTTNTGGAGAPAAATANANGVRVPATATANPAGAAPGQRPTGFCFYQFVGSGEVVTWSLPAGSSSGGTAFTQTTANWCALGLRAPASDNWDEALYDSPSLVPPCVDLSSGVASTPAACGTDVDPRHQRTCTSRTIACWPPAVRRAK